VDGIVSGLNTVLQNLTTGSTSVSTPTAPTAPTDPVNGIVSGLEAVLQNLTNPTVVPAAAPTVPSEQVDIKEIQTILGVLPSVVSALPVTEIPPVASGPVDGIVSGLNTVLQSLTTGTTPAPTAVATTGPVDGIVSGLKTVLQSILGNISPAAATPSAATPAVNGTPAAPATPGATGNTVVTGNTPIPIVTAVAVDPSAVDPTAPAVAPSIVIEVGMEGDKIVSSLSAATDGNRILVTEPVQKPVVVPISNQIPNTKPTGTIAGPPVVKTNNPDIVNLTKSLKNVITAVTSNASAASSTATSSPNVGGIITGLESVLTGVTSGSSAASPTATSPSAASSPNVAGIIAGLQSVLTEVAK
jgi:hypothetical protein